MFKAFMKITDGEGFPFIIPVIQKLNRLDFLKNITIIIGENGSGKSTLLELIAAKLRLPRISGDSAYSDYDLESMKKASNNFSIIGTKSNGFFFRSEDFINYALNVKKVLNEEKMELERVNVEYKKKDLFAYHQASTPHNKTIMELEGMYQRDLLNQSHGESFLDFFHSRLRKNNLYILDEVEAPLSFTSQLSLISLIKKYENLGCQFIISTHSPVLMAIPNASIYQIIDGEINQINYEDIEEIKLLKDFLDNKDRFLRYL